MQSHCLEFITSQGYRLAAVQNTKGFAKLDQALLLELLDAAVPPAVRKLARAALPPPSSASSSSASSFAAPAVASDGSSGSGSGSNLAGDKKRKAEGATCFLLA